MVYLWGERSYTPSKKLLFFTFEEDHEFRSLCEAYQQAKKLTVNL